MSRWYESRGVHLLSTALGIGLFVFLFWRVGVRDAFREASRIGWMFLLVFLLGGLPHLLRCVSWIRLLRGGDPTPGFRRMFAWWLAGEAISHLSFSWSGETYRVVVTRGHVDLARGAVAMALNRLLYSLASLVVIVVGLVILLALPGLPASWRSGVLQAVAVVAAVLLLASLALRFGHRLRSPSQGAAGAEEARWRRFLRRLREDLAALYLRGASEFGFLLGVNLLAALVGVAEVWLILWSLGVPISLAESLMVEGFLKSLSGLAYFVPGNIGVAEGGVVLVLKLIQASAAVGLALAVVRRARALTWVAVGGIVLLVLQAGGRPEKESLESPKEEVLESSPRR